MLIDRREIRLFDDWQERPERESGAPMKTAILMSIILMAAPAAAKTVIIEYPDHYYVEMTGVPAADPPARERRLPPLATPPATADGGVTVRPVTDFDNTPRPQDPAERRASMTDAMQRLRREHDDLTTPREGETSEQTGQRERQAAGMLRRINRMSSELLKMQ